MLGLRKNSIGLGEPTPTIGADAVPDSSPLNSLPGVTRVVLRGGGVDAVVLDASAPEVVTSLDQLAVLAPDLSAVHLTLTSPADRETILGRLNQLLASSEVIDTVCFHGACWGDAPAQVIGASPASDKLRTLWFLDCGMTDAGVAAVTHSAHLGRLEELDLSLNHSIDHGFAGLVARLPTALPSLRRLGLDDIDLTESLARKLAGQPGLNQLKELSIVNELLPAQGLQTFLDSPYCKDVHVIFNPEHLPDHARAEMKRRLDRHNMIGVAPAV